MPGQANGDSGAAADTGGGAAASRGRTKTNFTSVSEVSVWRKMVASQQSECVLSAGSAKHTQVIILFFPVITDNKHQTIGVYGIFDFLKYCEFLNLFYKTHISKFYFEKQFCGEA